MVGGFEALAISLGVSTSKLIFIMLIALFDGILKIIGMWKSARGNQLAWFIVLAIFNTAGILPIIYLLFFQKGCCGRKEKTNISKKRKKKR